MPTSPRAGGEAPRRLLHAPGQYLRRRRPGGPSGAPGELTSVLAARASLDKAAPADTAGVPASPTAARRRSPTRLELPAEVDDRLERATRARGGATKTRVIETGLRKLLAVFAERLDHPDPFPAPPPGRRVPRGRWTRSGPRRSITVKFDAGLLEQARGFLAHCRAAGIDPAQVEEITTLNELVTVAIERVLERSGSASDGAESESESAETGSRPQ